MEVIVIFTYGISLKDWFESGIQDREMLLYKNLEKIYNVKFTFITFGDSTDYSYFSGFEKSEILPFYTFTKRSKFKLVNFIKSLYFPFLVKKYFKNYNLIKTNQLSGAWIGIILKKLCNIPLIVRTGYNIYEFKVKENKSPKIVLFYKLLTKLSLSNSDLYIVTSNKDKLFIEKQNSKNKTIEVIPNWVSKISQNNFEDRHDKKILCVGRLESQKNFFTLLQNLKSTDFEIDIVGEGSEKRNLQELASIENIKVNFLGSLDHKALLNLYKNYKVFVTSSIYEGNPKTVLEALAGGCCVIATDIESHNEIIKDKINGFLFKDFTYLKSTIESVLFNKNVFNEISSHGYETIKNNHLIEVIQQKEIEIYQKLIKY